MSVDLAVVPVAGLGTRLLPATKVQPKEMLPVGRKPVVQYVVEELAAAGVAPHPVRHRPGKTSIENHFDVNAELIQFLRETGKEELLDELEFERAPVQYFYTRQRRRSASATPSCRRAPFVGDQPFVVALGDSIIGLDASATSCGAWCDVFEERGRRGGDRVRGGAARARCATTASPSRAATPGDVFELADVVEKPSAAEAPSTLAVAARYVFSPAIFDALARTTPGQGRRDPAHRRHPAPDPATAARVFGMLLGPGERRFDIGNFESYFRAFVEFALADPEHGPALREFVERLVCGPR